MTPKHKKHKQRFEHAVETINEDRDIRTIDNVLKDYEKQGYELVSSVVENEIYTLFFKRPV